MSELTGAALFGSIFYDSGASRRPLITDLDPHSPRVESFRVLRTNLQFLDVDKDEAKTAVTSSVPGDGKSTTAINIAIASAEAGTRVLLLEADLPDDRRSPTTSTWNPPSGSPRT